MSRPLRIEYENAFYHVMNRGRRENTFLTPPLTVFPNFTLEYFYLSKRTVQAIQQYNY